MSRDLVCCMNTVTKNKLIENDTLKDIEKEYSVAIYEEYPSGKCYLYKKTPKLEYDKSKEVCLPYFRDSTGILHFIGEAGEKFKESWIKLIEEEKLKREGYWSSF